MPHQQSDFASFLRSPLSIDPDWFQRFLKCGPSPLSELVGPRQAAASPEEVQAAGIGVIGIRGPLTPHEGEMTSYWGFVSYQGIARKLDLLLASPAVKQLVLDINSPGGSVLGCVELANKIRESRSIKPIHAVANHFAASAAMMLASSCSTVSVSPSGQVGSIGTYTWHVDVSQAEQKYGYKTTLVAAGKYKVEGNMYEPLGDEAQAEMQRVVDWYYAQFVDAVAAGRRVSVTKVLEDFGQGRMLLSEQAKTVGLVDRVATLDEVLVMLAQQGQAAASRARALKLAELG
jgi:capsid assembly protease